MLLCDAAAPGSAADRPVNGGDSACTFELPEPADLPAGGWRCLLDSAADRDAAAAARSSVELAGHSVQLLARYGPETEGA
jgi:hypothetical protein